VSSFEKGNEDPLNGFNTKVTLVLAGIGSVLKTISTLSPSFIVDTGVALVHHPESPMVCNAKQYHAEGNRVLAPAIILNEVCRGIIPPRHLYNTSINDYRRVLFKDIIYYGEIGKQQCEPELR
jgi:hypothetical protein